ncbi:hypothetical protein [Lyticum sinuosum]|uniref:Uncharacterized protein n=1 Tax=Lyticum sinuosum TaxID=1332059 RepID=A0AAE4VL18_9RICK|nr:hypothetical protein [Lyticum sinuosum]MDZ5761423.1 hypothetical protein [Lyticum sinuosum]
MLKKLQKAISNIEIYNPLVLNLINSHFAYLISTGLSTFGVSDHHIDMRYINFSFNEFLKRFNKSKVILNIDLQELLLFPNSWLWDAIIDNNHEKNYQIIIGIKDSICLYELLNSNDKKIYHLMDNVFKYPNIIVYKQEQIKSQFCIENLIKKRIGFIYNKELVFIEFFNNKISLFTKINVEHIPIIPNYFKSLPGLFELFNAILSSFVCGSGSGIIESAVMSSLYFYCCMSYAEEICRNHYKQKNIFPTSFINAVVDSFYEVNWNHVEKIINNWEFKL